ncbi:YgcG family protein [Sporosarcina sp. Marseille-Q4943]|uniref:TPM domain-containing protein n=1 Tax=Sporosarcina sp. Marseille-Q4943 TaxID=2942204 RepID=UPI00208DC25C|nr:TPM domain-containing protein [Sporosarcina sp. Marseille-Q4943]
MIRRTFRCMIAVCLSVMIMPAMALAADVPPWNFSDYYIQDHAGILSAEQKVELNRLGRQLNAGTGAELAVLTLPTIGAEPVETFAVKALREYGLGKKGEDNGALLVVTTIPYPENSEKGRHFELTVGYGLEGALPDGKVGRIMDEVAVPYLRNEQPDMAIMNAYKSYYNEIAAEYGWNGEVAEVNTLAGQGGGSGIGIPSPIIIFIIIFLLFRFMGGGRGGGGGPGGRRRGRGGMIFFPGGFGGGGGGGFSGGGGSGGGGGAGRSW